MNLHLSNVICKSVNSNSANWKKSLYSVSTRHLSHPLDKWSWISTWTAPLKSSYCSGLVKNYILCIHPSSSGVNAFSTASSVAQCLHCNISEGNVIVNWKCKPWSGESRSGGAGAHSLPVPSLQSWHRPRAQGDIPDAQLWIMDMPAWTKVYPMQLALGRNLFCIYKQAENSFKAVVESLLLLLILCTSAWQKARGTLGLYGLFHIYLQNEETKCQRTHDQNTWNLQTEGWSEIPCVCM